MFLYHLLAHLFALVAVPGLLVAALFSAKYRAGLGQRFGRLPAIPPPRPGAKRVWLHCASVGEVQTAASLIAGLRDDPRIDLVLSTMTPTGQALARSKYAARCPVVFWPVELARAVRRTMDAVRPDALLILETELWPAVLDEARARGVPVAVLSARVSDSAYRKYRLASFFFAPLLREISLFSVQTEEYARRLASLGVPTDRIRVTGNLKFDLGLDREALRATPSPIDAAWPARGPLFVAASTHDGEEDAAASAFLRARRESPDLRMVLAPRHVERAEAVARLLAARGVPFRRRTSLAPGEAIAEPVLLLDTHGELVPVLARADLCFVGGSLVPVGGHNILEPAALGVPVLFGPHMHNFREARAAILGAGGGIEVKTAEELAARAADLLTDPRGRERMGEAGRRVVAANAGASRRNLDLVADLLLRWRNRSA